MVMVLLWQSFMLFIISKTSVYFSSSTRDQAHKLVLFRQMCTPIYMKTHFHANLTVLPSSTYYLRVQYLRLREGQEPQELVQLLGKGEFRMGKKTGKFSWCLYLEPSPRQKLLWEGERALNWTKSFWLLGLCALGIVSAWSRLSILSWRTAFQLNILTHTNTEKELESSVIPSASCHSTAGSPKLLYHSWKLGPWTYPF